VTVDRVLHDRHNVRDSTRLEVEQAIRDLDKQRSQSRLAGRKYLFDVVMQAPQRFSSAFRRGAGRVAGAAAGGGARPLSFPSRPRSPRCEEPRILARGNRYRRSLQTLMFNAIADHVSDLTRGTRAASVRA
jgi:hypothetical protein